MVDAARDPAHVAVIGGGGSGHEPGDVGLMGRGMLVSSARGRLKIVAGPRLSSTGLCPVTSGQKQAF